MYEVYRDLGEGKSFVVALCIQLCNALAIQRMMNEDWAQSCDIAGALPVEYHWRQVTMEECQYVRTT